MAYLVPLRKNFLFSFIDETTSDGMFISKTKSGLFMTKRGLQEQSNFARWAKVMAIGSEVTQFNNGDYVLIEPLKWTQGFVYEGVKIWKSDEDKVIMVTDPAETNIEDLYNA